MITATTVRPPLCTPRRNSRFRPRVEHARGRRDRVRGAFGAEPAAQDPGRGERDRRGDTRGRTPADRGRGERSSRYRPQEQFDAEAGRGVETVNVNAGRTVLTVDGVEYEVEAGQSATSDGDVPHAYRGAGTQACEPIMTVHLPPGPVGAA